MTATGVDYVTAATALEQAGGHVKTAIVMLKSRVSPEEARERIVRAGGFVRQAIEGT
jgi:N-acetylmuramic acid 6-phosphate etherase